MKILTFSTLFPNTRRPAHGVFVETRLRYLVASGQVQARVVAPVPWFPRALSSAHPSFATYASYNDIPASEERFGLPVVHPRYPVIPKVGMTVAPALLAMAVRPTIARILDEGYDFDLIDAHYFYPDGVAAAMLARYFNKPLVITARGTDINLIPKHTLPRKMIQWAARRAEKSITVCEALREEMIGYDVDPARVMTLRNGVDLTLFQPPPAGTVRAERPFTLLTVGRLVEQKDQQLSINALPLLPGVELEIAGEGPDRPALEALVKKLGLEARVHFLGVLSQAQLRERYGAADALVLSSSREGWANVLLESMACGTPVVASAVWGTPEVVAAPEAGVLMRERTALGVADGVKALRANYPDRAATRRYAENFSWDATTQGQIDLFQSIIDKRA